ncbi:hypothetical protein NMG60_11016060 [Bertholletia excelsa]
MHAENLSMAGESSSSRDVVFKIGAKSDWETGESTLHWIREFPDSKKCAESPSRDDEEECEEEEEEDDDDDTILAGKRTFKNQSKSRLEDPYWRYKTDQAPIKKGKDRDNDDEQFEWTASAAMIFECVSLLLILLALTCTLVVPKLRKRKLWELHLWKWQILIVVLICGHLVSFWIVQIAILVMERNYIGKIRVLYFVYGLKKSMQNCLWLGQVSLAWNFILADPIGREPKHGAVRYVTKILICLWLATLIWLAKTLAVKVLASSFHTMTYFDRIKDSLFKQFVIKKLSGEAMGEEHSDAEEERKLLGQAKKPSTASWKRPGQRISIVELLQNMDRRKVSARSMKRLMMHMIQGGRLSTLVDELPSSTDEDETSTEIRDESEAKAAAKKVFQNIVASSESKGRYVFLGDLKRFMNEDLASKAMHLLQGISDKQGISLQSLSKWMVEAFKERRNLAFSLDDTHTAVDELHTVLNVVVTVIIVIFWALIFDMNLAHFIALVGTQILLAGFLFQDTCKRAFESIIFLFVTHPFDVGDRCQVDGHDVEVEEMNIMTTVFLRSEDKLLIHYPNSILATKPIGNFYRSPDMGDSVEFSIHISTPMPKIILMKKRILSYIEKKSEYWHKGAAVVVKDIEDMNRLRMVVNVRHRMNHQKMSERWARRALLIQEMIRVFKTLGIEYRMLPLDVNVRYTAPSRVPSNWVNL